MTTQKCNVSNWWKCLEKMLCKSESIRQICSLFGKVKGEEKEKKRVSAT
jgi:hypothetical protein